MRSVFGGKFRLIKATALIGAAVGVARQLRQRVVDQSPFSQPTTETADTAPTDTAPTDTAPADTADTAPAGAAPADTAPSVATPKVEGTSGSAPQSGEVRWVKPVDGQCPQGFPIKVKEASGIFHVPEGLFYKRTIPTRCYASEEDALADGFRKARR